MSEKRILIFDADTQMLSVVEERPDYQDETKVVLAEGVTPKELRIAILYLASVRKAEEEFTRMNDERITYSTKTVYRMFLGFAYFTEALVKENLL